MPSRVDRRWSGSDAGSDSGYSDSDSSYYTQSTAPTDYSRRPPCRHYESACQPFIGNPWAASLSENVDLGVRASVETYASTIPSEEDLDEDDEPFYVPEYEDERFPTSAVPSSPPDFAEYFPSTRILNIRHDDSTLDGNMNLRVDTEIRGSEGHRVDLTLFHLRMHDLKNREFSLRRYCRDSGREVCHSSRKPNKRPALQRSMSDKLSSLRPKSETKPLMPKCLKRHDSGYGSLSGDEFEVESVRELQKDTSASPLPTDTTHLEFSNYAHIDIKRRGHNMSSRQYAFEYWGTHYAWKRVIRRTRSFKETSFHLVNLETSNSIAQIVPATRTVAEAQEEDAKGGWVSPCSMWISDDRILHGQTDVADAIIATGLIALVDDCIKSRFHQKHSIQMTLPSMIKSPLKNMDIVGPKRLIDEVFNRRSHTSTRHPTPVRRTALEA